MKYVIKPTKQLSTICFILVIAVFRACQPEALPGNQVRDKNHIAAAAAAVAPGENLQPAALDPHLANNHIPLKQSFVESPPGGGGVGGGW